MKQLVLNPQFEKTEEEVRSLLEQFWQTADDPMSVGSKYIRHFEDLFEYPILYGNGSPNDIDVSMGEIFRILDGLRASNHINFLWLDEVFWTNERVNHRMEEILEMYDSQIKKMIEGYISHPERGGDNHQLIWVLQAFFREPILFREDEGDQEISVSISCKQALSLLRDARSTADNRLTKVIQKGYGKSMKTFVPVWL